MEDLDALLVQEEGGEAAAAAQLSPYQKVTLKMQRNREKLHRLQTFLASIGPCSGQNSSELREWLNSMEYALNYSGVSDADFLANTISQAREPLRTVLDLYLKKMELEKKPITWRDAKAEMVSACLSADESDYLRDMVEAAAQGQLEDIRTYILRFKEAVRRAYKPEEQEGLIQERLIKILIRGFLNPTVREKVILEAPKSIDEVAEKAISIARALHMAHQSLTPIGSYPKQLHEPMEVDANHAAKSSFESFSDGETYKPRSKSRSVDRATRKMDGLSMEKKTVGFSPRVSRRESFGGKSFPRNKSYVAEVNEKKGGVQCHFCQEVGHIMKDCKKKLRAENRCFGCKKIGHELKNCWSKDQASTQRGPAYQNKQGNYVRRGNFQARSTNNGFNRGRSAERFDREGLNKKRSTSMEKRQLLEDIGDFFATAKKDLGRGHDK